MKTTLGTMTTFAVSIIIGCGAAIAVGSTASIGQAAPILHPVGTAPVQVIRLDPVTVTISKAAYDAIRNEGGTQVARSTDARKVTRG